MLVEQWEMISNPLGILRVTESSDFFLFYTSQIRSNDVLEHGNTSVYPQTEGGATWTKTGKLESTNQWKFKMRLAGGVGNRSTVNLLGVYIDDSKGFEKLMWPFFFFF